MTDPSRRTETRAHRTSRRSERITVAAFLDKWTCAVEATVRPSTFHGIQSHVRHHLTPFVGDVRLRDLTGEMLNDLYARLALEGSAKGGKGLAPATVRRVHVTLHRALRDAVRWGYLDSNPCEAADPPKLSAHLRPEMKTWTATELATFLSHIKHDDWYALYHLIAMTGLRRGEALGLRWADVDLERGELAVRQTILQLRDGIHRSTPKSKRSARVVALDPRTVSILEGLRRADEGPGDLLFHQDGEPLPPVQVTKRFGKLARAARVPRIRLHDLRHTHATLALQAGVHPKIVSERLGHATVAFTLDVYSHAIPHMQTEAAARIASLVNGLEA